MAFMDRLRAIYGPVRLLWPAIWMHYVAFKEALHKDGLVSLIHLRRIRDAAAAKLLISTSAGFISYENSTVVPSLVRTAQGKTLELGPGAGNQIHRFDPSRVDFIYGIDPNTHFGDEIAAKLKKHDLQDNYKFLRCGIEDSDVLKREGITEGSMDTVLSIQVLCAVEDVQSVAREVWKLLRPGGRFIFWEHGKSKDALTAVTQVCWDPIWSAFVGCSMNRDIKSAILAAGEWENPGEIEETGDQYNCLPRISGVLIKKA